MVDAGPQRTYEEKMRVPPLGYQYPESKTPPLVVSTSKHSPSHNP